MGKIIDFKDYIAKKEAAAGDSLLNNLGLDISDINTRSCLNCKNTYPDKLLNLPVCNMLLSSYRGQIVTDECLCEFYIGADDKENR